MELNHYNHAPHSEMFRSPKENNKCNKITNKNDENKREKIKIHYIEKG